MNIHFSRYILLYHRHFFTQGFPSFSSSLSHMHIALSLIELSRIAASVTKLVTDIGYYIVGKIRHIPYILLHFLSDTHNSNTRHCRNCWSLNSTSQGDYFTYAITIFSAVYFLHATLFSIHIFRFHSLSIPFDIVLPLMSQLLILLSIFHFTSLLMNLLFYYFQDGLFSHLSVSFLSRFLWYFLGWHNIRIAIRYFDIFAVS